MIDIEKTLSDIGINSYDSNDRFLDELMSRPVTHEDVARLDPDYLDCNKFWELARLRDRCSILGGSQVEDNTDVEKINYTNGLLADLIGCKSYLHIYGHNKDVLEIGCGYGNIYSQYKDSMRYKGIDVVKNFDEAILTDGNGIPEELKVPNSFDIVYSCNVFQHISRRQKYNYVIDSHKVLRDEGFLILAFSTFSENHRLKNEQKTQSYCYSMGQVIPTVSIEDFTILLQSVGFVIMQTNVRFDGFTCFVCRKLPNNYVSKDLIRRLEE